MRFPGLQIIVNITLLSSFSFAQEGVGISSENDSNTEKYRVVWIKDPTTEATIGWNQKTGEPGVVHYGREDFGRKHRSYPHSKNVHRNHRYTEKINNCFAHLTELEPDTRYYFCIKDEAGISRRLSFKTASKDPKPFTFIAGGDSRNFREPRLYANRICVKLRPLFIAFTGDMINRDNEAEWNEWLDDWQHTISDDGEVIPIVPHRGNHERRPDTIPNYFDAPKNSYFDWAVGGDMFHYFALNSEIPANGEQGEWLEKRLKDRRKVIHLVAGYHKPMRPHVSKKSEGDNPYLWAEMFYKYGLDLGIESDSHVMKRTLPLKPDSAGSEGFSKASENDKNATTYIGEGCWGAPLRAADDAKPWTIATASFNGLDWIHVSPDRIQIKTVVVINPFQLEAVDPEHPFETPKGLVLWEPKQGTILNVPGDR